MAAKTPEDVDRLFGEYVNAGNAEGVVGLYEPDAVLLAPDGEARGTQQIRAAIEQLVAAKLRLQMNVTKVVRGGDTAVLYNDWSGSVIGPDGNQVAMSGKAIEVVRRQPDGTWKFVVDDPNARSA